MKKLLFLILLFATPALSDSVDINDRPELGAATSSDYFLGGDASADAGSRLRRILFSGTATECINGVGGWVVFGDLLADGTTPLTANWDLGAYTITGTQFISDIAIGTAPLVVTSTTAVANLNADLLDGTELAALTTDAELAAWTGTTNIVTLGTITPGVTVAASATPTTTFRDSDLLGADQEAAKILAQATTLTDGAEVTDFTITYMDAGTPTNALVIDGSDNQVEFAILTTLQANDVISSEIATIVESMAWNAAGTNSDGTQCAAPAEVTINSGPITYSTICTDNDASSIYGHVVMPDSWDGGTVTMESEYLQSAVDTGVLNGDITMMCRSAADVVNSTWGTEIAIDDAAVGGSNRVDHTTSAAITPNGTCAAGDSLFWRYQMDATGTTTAVATLHFLSWKMEYTSNVGD